MDARSRLAELLDSDGIIVAPGVYDGISAKVVESMGFETAIISGAGVSNSRLGTPDVGVLDLSENAGQCRTIANAVDLPVHADADTGYGNAVNVYHTVETLERTGVAAVRIEDQTWPKRCGHMAGKSVVPMEEMCRKVEAAVAARDDTDPDMLVKARTDAAVTHGVEEAVRRLDAYVDCGADMVFADSLSTEADIRYAASNVDAPLTVNMGYGIVERPTTPLVPPRTLEEWGVAMVSYPRLITGAAVRGMQNAFVALEDAVHSDEVETAPHLTVDFEEYTDLIGLPEFEALEARFGSE